MRRPIDRSILIALAVVMMAATLAACGRKGPLDAPPSAALTPPPAATRPSLGEESDSLTSQSGASAPARPQAGARQAAAPPPPQKTSFFLDFLLGR